jgi:hypothetical protein
MSSTAVAAMQTTWDCRWSRPGHRLTGVEDRLQPETKWVCVRTGVRECIGTEECEQCVHWEAEAAVTLRVPIEVPPSKPATAVGTAVAEAAPPLTAGELQAIGFRSVLVLTAVGVVATGFTLLTSIVAVPITIGLWLGAAALVGAAVFGQFPTS